MRILTRIFLTTVLAAVSLSQVKITPTPEVMTPFSESLQIVVVTTDDWDATIGRGRLFDRSSPKARWKANGKEFDIVIGRSGSAWAADSSPGSATNFKKEGDGRSPAGLFPLKYAFGFRSKPDQLKFPYTKIEESTECVDDAASSHYNKVVDRFKVGNFDWKSSEKMREIDPEYELGVFVAYNSYPVRSGVGSCIFLHVWRDVNTPTSGCTAMQRSDLEKIVLWLKPNAHPYFALIPKAEYKILRKSESLPEIK